MKNDLDKNLLTNGGFINHRLLIFALVSLEVLLAACLTFFLLGDKSLWYDEVASIYISRNWTDMWYYARETGGNMQLYYLFLHWWLRLGDSEFIVRSLSAIFAMAAVPAVYALGSRLFDKRAGLIGALILAVNPFFIRYAQEARGYSLLILLVTLSSYFFLRLIESPSLKNTSGYIIFSVLAALTHYFGILVPMSQAVSLVFRRRFDIPWKRLVTIGGIIVVIVLIFLLPFFVTSSPRLGWIPRPEPIAIAKLFYSFSGKSPFLFLLYFVLCCSAIHYGMKLLKRAGLSNEAWRYPFLITWLCIPVALTYVFSVLLKPLFWPRYLSICLPALVVLAGVGLTQIKHCRLYIAAIVTLIIFSGHGIYLWYTGFKKENWRAAAVYVAAEAKPGDALVFHAEFLHIAFDYYLQRNHTPLDRINRVRIGLKRGKHIPESVYNKIEQLPGKYSRVWLVLSHHNIPSLGGDVQARIIRNALRRNYNVEQERKFREIRVLLYDRRPIDFNS